MQDDFRPLAARQAPKKIEDFAGQPHLLGPGKMLRRLLETDTLKSAVFFGPPGCGKTATARYVASRTQAHVAESMPPCSERSRRKNRMPIDSSKTITGTELSSAVRTRSHPKERTWPS